MADTISLEGLNKADVLAALYNVAKPLGMGFLHYDPQPMTTEEAQSILDSGATYFDYLKGRVMKVNLSGNDMNPGSFDRDNGAGSAATAIAALRDGLGANPQVTAERHRANVTDAATTVREHLADDTETIRGDGLVTVRLGLADVAGPLSEAVDRAVAQ
jgi:hypothetical protein